MVSLEHPPKGHSLDETKRTNARRTPGASAKLPGQEEVLVVGVVVGDGILANVSFSFLLIPHCLRCDKTICSNAGGPGPQATPALQTGYKMKVQSPTPLHLAPRAPDPTLKPPTAATTTVQDSQRGDNAVAAQVVGHSRLVLPEVQEICADLSFTPKSQRRDRTVQGKPERVLIPQADLNPMHEP